MKANIYLAQVYFHLNGLKSVSLSKQLPPSLRLNHTMIRADTGNNNIS